MNLLLLDAAKYWSGGAERVYLCAKGFKQKGHNVVVICLPTSRLNLLLKNEVIIYNIHPVSDLDIFAAIKIVYVLLKHKIGVIDVHSPKFYWLGVFISKILNKKVFITRNVEYRKKGIKKIINRFLYNFCNGVIAVSEKIKKDLMEDFKLKEGKIKVIYDAVNINPQVKNIRNNYNIPQDAIVFSIIGRIEENKGQHIAVEVVKKLLDKGYNTYLFVVGQAESQSYYKNLVDYVKKNQLVEKVIFTGFVSNIEDFIFSSDIVLCCSKYEGMSKVILISIMIGKPVVTTEAVKVSEVLGKEHLKFIKFVPVRNVQNFVNSTEEVIKNLSFYKKESQNFSLQKVSYEKMVDEYLNFYYEKNY
jgi:glycosyltransferase involved in cell wall biosynthesis